MEENKKYYYADDDLQIGPLTFTELKLSNIKPQTLVWFEGMKEWTEAKNIDELKNLFSYSTSTPPPLPSKPNKEYQIPQSGKQSIQQQKPHVMNSPQISHVVWKSANYKDSSIAMLFFFFFLAPIGFLLVVTKSEAAGVGAGMLGIGFIFLPIYYLIKKHGKELYRLGFDYSNNIVWIDRPSQKKIHKENWANRIISVEVVKQMRRKFITGSLTPVNEKKWELYVKLKDSPHSWPLPGSVFFTKKEAEAVYQKINTLIK